MKQLKTFRELSGDPTDAPFTSVRGKSETGVTEALARYLRSGLVVAAAPSIPKDVISQERGKGSPPIIRTDGEWIWNEQLAYYVEEYGVGVDAEFSENALRLEGAAPEVSPEVLSQARSQFFGPTPLTPDQLGL